MSQQRWQSNSLSIKQHSNFNKQQQSNKSNKSYNHLKKNQSLSSLPSSSTSSSVTELPETFGLPSNFKSSALSSSSAKNKQSNKSLNKNADQNEILIDDTVVNSPKNIQSDQSIKTDDIEIISENFSSSVTSLQSNLNSNNTNEDLNLRNHLTKTYNTQILIATKPQTNFISNLNCINQILNKIDYYNNKLRRCKPYSNIRASAILNYDDSSEDEEEGESNEDSNKASKIKNKKVILIDDTNEEMHKPWITPELIKLIKHRNLLQEKINETGGLNEANRSSNTPADQELLKKFKNLRNKVTKLVKKARKDYLAKYAKENKLEVKTNSGVKPAEPNESTLTLTATTSSTTTTTTATTATLSTESLPAVKPASHVSLVKTSNIAVNEITAKIGTNSGSFLKDQAVLMKNLYSTYYTQYIQQYTKQQQELAEEMAAAKKKKRKTINETDDDGAEEATENYDVLQKQAAAYAEQQLAIQKQLENSLKSAAEQLIQEIANSAAVKTSQTQQHQMGTPLVSMVHHHHNQVQQQQQQQQMMSSTMLQHHHHPHHQYAGMPMGMQRQQTPAGSMMHSQNMYY
jgi:hypothetical protein